MAAATTFTLCWNGNTLGRITDAVWSDFPWASGKFASGDWPTDLRIAIEWLARSDETCAGPPFDNLEPYCEGWTVIDQDGEVSEIGPPIVDFTAGEIEWR